MLRCTFRVREERSLEVAVNHLSFVERGQGGFVGGGAISIDEIISTRRSNGSSWVSMQGKHPAGKWELALPNTEGVRNRFKNEDITDIIIVSTYSVRRRNGRHKTPSGMRRDCQWRFF